MQPFFFLLHIASQLSRVYFPYACSFEYEVGDSIFLEKTWIQWAEQLYHRSDRTCGGFSRCFSTGESRRILAVAACTQVKICADNDIAIVAFSDAGYPPLLRHISDPPLSLFIKGDPEVLLRPQISVIGSRRCSKQAAQHAYTLGYKAAQHGISIVSGGAYGCDIAAHQGVLQARGVPALAVIVFAGGFPLIGPQGNLRYFREIEANRGVWLTERLWGTFSQRRDFPIRNRLISGLSPVTVVIQAGIRSGTMVTAKMALDQGRELLTFQYGAEDPWSEGNRTLIEDGAEYVDSAEALLHLVSSRSTWGHTAKGAEHESLDRFLV
jgi:DNA processing protein